MVRLLITVVKIHARPLALRTVHRTPPRNTIFPGNKLSKLVSLEFRGEMQNEEGIYMTRQKRCVLPLINKMSAVRQRRVKHLQSVQTPPLHYSLCPTSEIGMRSPSQDTVWLRVQVIKPLLHLLQSLSILL